MARKYTKPVAPPKPDDGAEDLFVLLPDVTVEIAGRTLTVREYNFIAGMAARAKGKPLTDALLHIIQQRDAEQDDIEAELDLLAQHQLLVRELMADSVDGADADWIAALDAPSGERLLRTWWGVCGRFFIRLALRKLIVQVVRQAKRDRAANPSAGPTSSPSLPPADTAPPANSATATPSVN